MAPGCFLKCEWRNRTASLVTVFRKRKAQHPFRANTFADLNASNHAANMNLQLGNPAWMSTMPE
jgi:hypothetical protein